MVGTPSALVGRLGKERLMVAVLTAWQVLGRCVIACCDCSRNGCRKLEPLGDPPLLTPLKYHNTVTT